MTLQLTPYAIATIMFKRKRAAIITFLLVVLSGAAYLILTSPKYESVAMLVVRFGERSVPDVSRGQQGELTPADRREIVLANANILRSHDLARATIDAFGLDRIYPDIADDPPSRWSPMDEAMRVFQRDLSIDVGRDDNVISVSLLHPDQSLTPQIVQKLIDLYVARQMGVYQNPQADFLGVEVKQAGQRLATAQAALEAFKSQWHITDIDQEVIDLLKQRGDVDTNLRQAESNLYQARQRQSNLERLLAGVPANVPGASSGEIYRSLDDARQRLADLRTKESQMLATYSANSPALSQLRSGIRETQAEVRARQSEVRGRSASNPNVVHQTLQTDYLRAQADARSAGEPVRVLTGQLRTIDERLRDLRDVRGKYNNLRRATDIAESAYRALSDKFEDARVKISLNQQNISPATMISKPTVPYRPARPRKLITALACLMGGAVLAFGVIFGLEGLDDRFTTGEQVMARLGVPVLASFGRPGRVASPL